MNLYQEIAGNGAKQCINCKFFCQHYVAPQAPWEDFIPIGEGHCTSGRIRSTGKMRKAFDFCPKFEHKDDKGE